MGFAYGVPLNPKHKWWHFLYMKTYCTTDFGFEHFTVLTWRRCSKCDIVWLKKEQHLRDEEIR